MIAVLICAIITRRFRRYFLRSSTKKTCDVVTDVIVVFVEDSSRHAAFSSSRDTSTADWPPARDALVAPRGVSAPFPPTGGRRAVLVVAARPIRERPCRFPGSANVLTRTRKEPVS
ncbi:hypothetical protein MRX96_056463 [Rhipicephalus microplus]